MVALIWLHVAAMFVAFAIFVGGGAMVRLVAYRGSAAAVRELIAAVDPMFRVGGLAAAIGVVAGLILARNFGYGAPWLIGAYILTALAAGLGNAIDATWANRLAAADDQRFESVRRERIPALSGALGAVFWLAVLWLMIAKPGA